MPDFYTTAISAVAMLLLLGLGLRRPDWALAAYAFAVACEAAFPEGLGNVLTKMTAAIMVVAFLVAHGRSLKLVALSRAGWLWFAWAEVSFVWALNRSDPEVYLGLLNLLMQIAALIVVANAVARSPHLAPQTLWAYSAGATVSAAVAFGQVGLGSIAERMHLAGAAAPHFGATLLMAFVFLYHQTSAGRLRATPRMLAIAAIAPLALGMLLSGTRSVWSGAIVALILPALLSGRRATIVAAALLALAILVTLREVPEWRDFAADRLATAVETGGAGRADIWLVGLQLVREHPLIGVGYRNFQFAFTQPVIDRTPMAFTSRLLLERRGPHNIYLGTAAELGIVGLALLLYWFVRLAVRTYRARGLGPMVTCILVAYFIVGMFLEVLNRKYLWLAIALAEGIAFAAQTRNEAAHEEESVAPTRVRHLPLTE
jgi:O-antigen ligase